MDLINVMELCTGVVNGGIPNAVGNVVHLIITFIQTTDTFGRTSKSHDNSFVFIECCFEKTFNIGNKRFGLAFIVVCKNYDKAVIINKYRKKFVAVMGKVGFQ